MHSLETAAFPLLAASLLGSPHCGTMCGGFVALYAHHSRRSPIPHLLYNCGRLCTYLTLGVLVSIAGAALDGVIFSGHLVAVLVGAVLIALGLAQLIFGRGTLFSTSLSRGVGSVIGKIAKPLFSRDSAWKPFWVGIVTTLLPCGWLYVFLALAMGSGEPVTALKIMFLFWIGTLPMMVGIGVLSQELLSRLGLSFPRMTGLLLILSGILSVMIHLQHASHLDHHSGGGHHPPAEAVSH